MEGTQCMSPTQLTAANLNKLTASARSEKKTPKSQPDTASVKSGMSNRSFRPQKKPGARAASPARAPARGRNVKIDEKARGSSPAGPRSPRPSPAAAAARANSPANLLRKTQKRKASAAEEDMEPEEKGVLYRGLAGLPPHVREAHSKLAEGDEIQWAAPSSCAANPKISRDYVRGAAANATKASGGTVFFTIEQGTQSGLPLQDISKYPREAEVLLPPLTHFEVVHATLGGKKLPEDTVSIRLRYKKSPIDMTAFMAEVLEDSGKAAQKLDWAVGTKGGPGRAGKMPSRGLGGGGGGGFFMKPLETRELCALVHRELVKYHGSLRAAFSSMDIERGGKRVLSVTELRAGLALVGLAAYTEHLISALDTGELDGEISQIEFLRLSKYAGPPKPAQKRSATGRAEDLNLTHRSTGSQQGSPAGSPRPSAGPNLGRRASQQGAGSPRLGPNLARRASRGSEKPPSEGGSVMSVGLMVTSPTRAATVPTSPSRKGGKAKPAQPPQRRAAAPPPKRGPAQRRAAPAPRRLSAVQPIDATSATSSGRRSSTMDRGSTGLGSAGGEPTARSRGRLSTSGRSGGRSGGSAAPLRGWGSH